MSNYARRGDASFGAGDNGDFGKSAESPYERLARTIGGDVGTDQGRPCVRVEVGDALDFHCATKILTIDGSGRVAGHLTATAEGRLESGLIGAVSDIVESECRRVLMVRDEADLAAVLNAAEREGVELIAVCHSGDPGGGAGYLGDVAACFGTHCVIVVYPSDETALAESHCVEIREADPAMLTNFVLPISPAARAAGCRTLRDYLQRCRGTVVVLLRLARAAPHVPPLDAAWGSPR